MRFCLLVCFIVLSPGISAEEAAGKAAFATCGACHSIDGSAKATGPTLKGIVGKKAASDKAFARYSKALLASGITWTATELDAYLKKPADRVKGTTMVVSLPDDKRRAAVIRYLQTLKSRESGTANK